MDRTELITITRYSSSKKRCCLTFRLRRDFNHGDNNIARCWSRSTASIVRSVEISRYCVEQAARNDLVQYIATSHDLFTARCLPTTPTFYDYSLFLFRFLLGSGCRVRGGVWGGGTCMDGCMGLRLCSSPAKKSLELCD